MWCSAQARPSSIAARSRGKRLRRTLVARERQAEMEQQSAAEEGAQQTPAGGRTPANPLTDDIELAAKGDPITPKSNN